MSSLRRRHNTRLQRHTRRDMLDQRLFDRLAVARTCCHTVCTLPGHELPRTLETLFFLKLRSHGSAHFGTYIGMACSSCSSFGESNKRRLIDSSNIRLAPYRKRFFARAACACACVLEKDQEEKPSPLLNSPLRSNRLHYPCAHIDYTCSPVLSQSPLRLRS